MQIAHDIRHQTRFANLYIDDVVATTSLTVPTINVGMISTRRKRWDYSLASKGFSDAYFADSAVLYFSNDKT